MKFNVIETIKKRYSVRSYDSRKVADTLRKDIIDYANALENPFGGHIKCKFIDKNTSTKGEKLGTYGMIKNASLYMGVSIEKEEGYLEALGYEFEELVLYMTSLGLGTCWLGGTFNKGAFSEIMNISENEVFPIVTPVGYASTLTLKDKMIRTSLKADKRKDWSVLFFDNDFNTPLSKDIEKEYKEALEMLRLAPSAANQQPWRVVYKDGIFHFFEYKTLPSTEVDMQRIDVGIAICHFDLTLKEKGICGQFRKVDVSHIQREKNMIYVTSYMHK